MINAVKYNENALISILIKISEIQADGKSILKLEFIDNGMGIEHYRKEKIFMVGNREFKGGRGMGLGLSLVKKIVESYSGKIMVEDKVPGDYSKGSNFIVLIPKSN
jgi:signal transduction histidine kinase